MSAPVLKVMRLDPEAVLPSYARPGDAGLDLRAVESVEIGPRDRALVRTGIALELPPGTEGQIRPRSGLALDTGITVLNAPGTIDEGYRGEIGVILINLGDRPHTVSKGDRIAQLVVHPVVHLSVEETTTLRNSERGYRGFGSSGKK